MPDNCDIRWFKQTFGGKINAALRGTPFTLDFVTALACQETGEVWPILRKKDLSLDRLLELCVGDTLDTPNRSAFPKNKAALIAFTNGQAMFDVARQALVDMAQFISSYRGAANRPNKFCHGFGVFQFDIQFFKNDPNYFLNKDYADFDKCLARALRELKEAQRKISALKNKTELTDREMAHVAIAYNTGGFNPAKGLDQGHRPPGGKFYGRQIFDFINQAKAVPLEDQTQTLPFTVDPNGPLFKVKSTKLNLRSEPCVDSGPASNVKAELQHGHEVQAITNQLVRGFLDVATDVDGARERGFVSFNLLEPA
jgi:hypothetical protein